jgi:hypothetical protein
MMHTFYFLLQESGYNWDESRKVFENLTDLQIAWINYMSDKVREKQRFYDRPGQETVKSFDLRRR